jgi:predicted RNase H-like HicB family nuclease
MKKLLAIVQPTADGFRGYVPRLPGCEVRAATAEQAEADISDAARAHLAANKDGTNGFRPDEVEIVVAVQPLPPPLRHRGDGLDEIYNEMGNDFNPEELELLLNWDEHKWFTFEEVMAELGLDATESPTGETPQ